MGTLSLLSSNVIQVALPFRLILYIALHSLTLLDLGSKLNTKTWRVDKLSTLGLIRLVFLQFSSKLPKFILGES